MAIQQNEGSPSPYDRLKEIAFARSIPLTAQFEITYKCNHLCSFCYNAPTGRKEMTTPQIFEALQKVNDLGVLFVILTGGEPLCHKDFYKIGAEVGRLGMALRIYSNGFLMSDPKVVSRICDLNPLEVEISLHGAGPGSHEALTNIKGSFERTIRGIGNLTQAGVKVNVKCPITRLNRGELFEIKDLATKLGAYMTFDAVITPKDDGSLDPLSLRADEEFFRKYWTEDFGRLHDGRKPPRKNACDADDKEAVCGAGRTGFTIDPYGGILPCSAIRKSAGNILDVEDMKEFWESATILREVREQAVGAREKLNRNENGPYFLFCMGVAEKETGDPLGMYPQAEINARAIRHSYESPQIDD